MPRSPPTLALSSKTRTPPPPCRAGCLWPGPPPILPAKDGYQAGRAAPEGGLPHAQGGAQGGGQDEFPGLNTHVRGGGAGGVNTHVCVCGVGGAGVNTHVCGGGGRLASAFLPGWSGGWPGHKPHTARRGLTMCMHARVPVCLCACVCARVLHVCLCAMTHDHACIFVWWWCAVPRVWWPCACHDHVCVCVCAVPRVWCACHDS